MKASDISLPVGPPEIFIALEARPVTVLIVLGGTPVDTRGVPITLTLLVELECWITR